tara:strand:+ start:153 stop:365 length:213 start_codon:yes stop_codon:yes gene_type:complete
MKAIKNGNKPRTKRKTVTRTNRKGETIEKRNVKVLGPKEKGFVKKGKTVTKTSPEGVTKIVKAKTKSKRF